MDRLRFSNPPPPESVLSNFEFCTQDIEEAQEWGRQVFCENRLSGMVPGSLDARMCYRRLGGIGLGRISYGSDVTIDPGVLDSFLLIQLPIRGSEWVEVAERKVISTPNLASIINPGVAVRVKHSRLTEKLIVRIDRTLLEQHCQQYLGYSLRKPLVFEPGMPMDSESGQRWLQLMSWLYSGPFASPGELPALVVAQIENMLTSMLLTGQPHNYSQALEQDEPRIVPAFVKRAELYIQEHAGEPIGVPDIAAHAGVSGSSLFSGFKRFRATSPMNYLKEVRLRHVRDELERAKPGETSVTAVAFRWGFGHMGHFASDYKRRFGESPSETLTR